MLVDLARNDVNRVCESTSTKVDKLMLVQKVKHARSDRANRARCDEVRWMLMNCNPVFPRAAPGLGGLRGVAIWQDAIRCVPLHFPRR